MRIGGIDYRNNEIALRVSNRSDKILDKIEGLRVFKLTREMLERGTEDYKFIIWEDDQWVGSNSNEVLQIRSDGHIYLQKKKIIEL